MFWANQSARSIFFISLKRKNIHNRVQTGWLLYFQFYNPRKSRRFDSIYFPLLAYRHETQLQPIIYQVLFNILSEGIFYTPCTWMYILTMDIVIQNYSQVVVKHVASEISDWNAT